MGEIRWIRWSQYLNVTNQSLMVLVLADIWFNFEPFLSIDKACRLEIIVDCSCGAIKAWQLLFTIFAIPNGFIDYLEALGCLLKANLLYFFNCRDMNPSKSITFANFCSSSSQCLCFACLFIYDSYGWIIWVPFSSCLSWQAKMHYSMPENSDIRRRNDLTSHTNCDAIINISIR